MEMSQLLRQLLEYAKKQLNSLAYWRDGSLVIGGALYLLGYIAWCAYAWLNHLSLLPALSSQYIMAGAIIGSIFVVIALLRILREWLLVSLDPPVGWKLKARWAILFLWICEFLLALMSPFVGTRVQEIVPILFLATWLLVLPVPRWREALETLKASITKIEHKVFRDSLGSMVDLLSQLLSWGVRIVEEDYPRLATILLCGIGIFFTFFAFLAMPQQLGGVHPRCAYLDIDTGMTSPEVYKEIIPPKEGSQAGQTGGKVERSVKLDVLFSGGDTILVRKTTDKMVYEISRKIVQTTIWCND